MLASKQTFQLLLPKETRYPGTPPATLCDLRFSAKQLYQKDCRCLRSVSGSVPTSDELTTDHDLPIPICLINHQHDYHGTHGNGLNIFSERKSCWCFTLHFNFSLNRSSSPLRYTGPSLSLFFSFSTTAHLTQWKITFYICSGGPSCTIFLHSLPFSKLKGNYSLSNHILTQRNKVTGQRRKIVSSLCQKYHTRPYFRLVLLPTWFIRFV